MVTILTSTRDDLVRAEEDRRVGIDSSARRSRVLESLVIVRRINDPTHGGECWLNGSDLYSIYCNTCTVRCKKTGTPCFFKIFLVLTFK